MAPRLCCLSLILAASLSAQDPQPVPQPQQPQQPDVAQEQVPEKPTPEQRIAELEAQLAKIRTEQSAIAEVQAKGGLMARVKSYLAHRTLTPRTVAVKTPVQPSAAKTGVRLLGDEEKARLGPDVIFTVQGQPVTKAEFDDLLVYFKSYPRPESDDDLKKAVVKALVIQKATAATFHNSGQKARARIADAKARLDKGEDFATVATEMSQCPSAAQGGDLNLFSREQMDPMFAKTAFTLKVGQTSEIVQSAFGYHLIKVTAHEKGDTPAADRVRASHILASYDPDQQRVREVMMAAQNGQVDLAFASDEYRKFSPDGF